MNVVLDTSVLIAAFYQPLHRPCFSRDVYDYLVDHETVYLSAYILHEFRTTCTRKLKMTPATVRHLESLIRSQAHLEKVEPAKWIAPENFTLRDEKDLPIIQLALSIQADLLLTWDKDMLVLRKVGPTSILNPRDFWNRLNK